MSFFNRIPFLNDQKYERYLPTAFDESMSILQKLNKIIEFLNNVIDSNNSIADYVEVEIPKLRNEFEVLREWVENEGLQEKTSLVLNEWFDSGKLAEIINIDVFNMKANQSDLDETNSLLAEKTPYVVTSQFENLIVNGDYALAINGAIDYAKTNELSRVKIPFRVTPYVIKTPIETSRKLLLEGEIGVTIDCSQIPTPNYAIRITEGDGTLRATILKNIIFKGHPNATSFIQNDYTNPVNFTPLLTGFNINSNSFTVESCYFMGFDQVTDFKNGSYLVTFEKCQFRFSNYGVYYEVEGTNMGENIVFSNCVIDNNNYGIYDNLGMLRFEGCSIDYNRKEHIKDNISKVGGVSSGGTHFNTCHFENLIMNTGEGVKRIVNNGIMYFDNCTFWDDEINYFENTDKLIVTNPTLRFSNKPKGYLFNGQPPIFKNETFTSNDFCMMVHPKLSKVVNGDFETGTLDGWTVVNGTATADTTKVNGGIKSAKLTGTASTGCEIKSKKMLVPSDKFSFFLHFYVNSFLAGGTSYSNIKFYDVDDLQVYSQDFTVGVGTSDSFVYHKSDWKDIPKEALYFIVTLKLNPTGDTRSIYYDDVYVSFR